MNKSQSPEGREPKLEIHFSSRMETRSQETANESKSVCTKRRGQPLKSPLSPRPPKSGILNIAPFPICVGGSAACCLPPRSSTMSTGRLSLLAPYLKLEYHWTNTDYANLVIGFRIAYSIGQTVFGRLMDRHGYAARIVAHSYFLFTGVRIDFAGERLLQLCDISFLCWAWANPETGPQQPKLFRNGFRNANAGLRHAFFDSGSSVGGAIAPG